jgi:uncharacterized membrane protein YeaQ/YmgE (transglycosylase-associated protein family)
MSPVEFLILLVVAGICGGVAQSLGGYTPRGCFVTIILGFIGAVIGTWLARVMGLPELFTISIGGKPFPIIWSIIGGALFCAVLNLIGGRARS